jgi:hypothetical protein
MSKKIDVSKIKVDFGENDKLKDEHFIALLKKAYQGEIMCRMASIKMEAIEPSTDYEPEASEDFRRYFLDKMKEENPIPMFVYQKDGKFKMSDDYNSYYLYKELEASVVPCVVVGNIEDMKDVLSIGEPFQLESPTLQVMN